jgi:hypothetical protein
MIIHSILIVEWIWIINIILDSAIIGHQDNMYISYLSILTFEESKISRNRWKFLVGFEVLRGMIMDVFWDITQ